MELLTTINERMKNLINSALKNVEGIEINFAKPEKEVTKPTVNIFLYDIRENLELRAHTTYITYTKDIKTEQKNILQAAPTYVNFSYIITAWGGVREDENNTVEKIISMLLNILLFESYLPLTSEEKSAARAKLQNEQQGLKQELQALEKELRSCLNVQGELPEQEIKALEELKNKLEKLKNKLEKLKNKLEGLQDHQKKPEISEAHEKSLGITEKSKKTELVDGLWVELNKLKEMLITEPPLSQDAQTKILENEIKPKLKMQLLHPLYLQGIGEFWNAIGSTPKPIIHCTITAPIL